MAGSHLGDLMSGASPRSGAPSGSGSSLLRTAMGLDDVSASFSPLERILITANGNLQRIVSSFHARPVEVHVVYNIPIPNRSGEFKRAVDISLVKPTNGAKSKISEDPGYKGKVCFCRATSRVSVTNPRMLEALASKRVGIGQLFRHFDAFPVFTLLDVRRGVLDSTPEELLAKHDRGTVDNVVENRLNSGSNGDTSTDEDELPEQQVESQEGMPFWRLYRLSANGISCLIHEQFLGKVL